MWSLRRPTHVQQERKQPMHPFISLASFTIPARRTLLSSSFHTRAPSPSLNCMCFALPAIDFPFVLPFFTLLSAFRRFDCLQSHARRHLRRPACFLGFDKRLARSAFHTDPPRCALWWTGFSSLYPRAPLRAFPRPSSAESIARGLRSSRSLFS